MLISRRKFLGTYAALHFAGVPSFVNAESVSGKRILTVLLRGGMDGLYVLPPKFDPGLERVRPRLLNQKYEDLNSDFQLISSLSFVRELYDAGDALLVHASSFPYTGRSHFDGQNIMESGVMAPYSSKTGWLGRLIDQQEQNDYIDKLSLSLPTPLIMRGRNASLNYYPTWMPRVAPEEFERMEPMYADFPELGATLKQLYDRDDDISLRMTNRHSGQVKLEDLASEAAIRFNNDDGPRVAVLDHLGFDTHANAPFETDRLLSELDNALRKFKARLRPEVWADTYIVTVTEFGRTVAENNMLGTEHGYGTVNMVLGGAVKKSGVISDWPGLNRSSLFEGRDLLATIDARSVYGSVLRSYLNSEHDLIRQRVLDYPVLSKLDEYI